MEVILVLNCLWDSLSHCGPRCHRSCGRGANFLLLFTLPLFRQRLSKGGRLKLLLVSQVGGELASAEAEEPLTAEGH
jgi:hypothetical protein